MPQQIAPEFPGSRAALALLDAANTGTPPLPFELKPLSRLAERELSARVEQGSAATAAIA